MTVLSLVGTSAMRCDICTLHSDLQQLYRPLNPTPEIIHFGKISHHTWSHMRLSFERLWVFWDTVSTNAILLPRYRAFSWCRYRWTRCIWRKLDTRSSALITQTQAPGRPWSTRDFEPRKWNAWKHSHDRVDSYILSYIHIHVHVKTHWLFKVRKAKYTFWYSSTQAGHSLM